MRTFIRLFCVAALLLGLSAVSQGDSPRGSASLALARGREVELTYLARVRRMSEAAGEVDVWIPLAKTSREQKLLRRQVRSPVPYAIHQDPEYGNDILHLRLQGPVAEPLEVRVDYHALLLGDSADLEKPALSPGERGSYLRPRGLLIVDEAVRARSQEATAGRPTLLARARGIYEHVLHSMVYDKTTPGYGRGDTARACRVGKGNCTDFHSLFISLAMAAEIPSRFKIGFVVPPEPAGTIPGYHCWAEFYEEDRGWVPVDASESWKHPERTDYYFGGRDPNRFLVSMGRNIELVPAQRGEPVNIFFYPYVEADGNPLDAVETEFRFRELQARGPA